MINSLRVGITRKYNPIPVALKLCISYILLLVPRCLYGGVRKGTNLGFDD